MPARVHVIASGKGGVGKSTVAVGLATALASQGRSVLLVDGDLAQGTLYLHLGLTQAGAGVREFFADPRATVSTLLQQCPALGIEFLAAGGETLGMTHLHVQRIARLLRALRGLPRDEVVLDLSAGSAHNTLDLFAGGDLRYIVLTPDPPSVLAAFAFVKAALFRAMYRALPDDSELGLAAAISHKRAHLRSAPEPPVLDILAGEQREQLEQIRQGLQVRTVVNMADAGADLAPGKALARVVRERLGVHTQAVGCLIASPDIQRAQRNGKPWPLAVPKLSRGLDAWASATLEVQQEPATAVPCVIGFNQELQHGDHRLHVQTEDLGSSNQVASLVYRGGLIVFRIQRELQPGTDRERAAAVQHQHRTLIRGILGGRLDDVLLRLAGEAA